MNLDALIISGSAILFSLILLFFAVYSLLSIYALVKYGRSKSLTSAVAFIYFVLVAGLAGWGLNVLSNLN